MSEKLQPWWFERVWQSSLVILGAIGVLIFALYNPGR